MEALIYSQSLTIAMGVLCGLTCVVLMVMFLMGRVRKKESPTDAVLVCNIFFTFFITSIFQLAAVVLQAILNSNMDLRQSSAKWCKVVGAFGLYAIIIGHCAMLSLATYLVWCQIKLKKFKRNKTVWVKMILLFEYLAAAGVAVLTVLPIAYFQETQQFHESSLCLPLHAPGALMSEFTLALLILEGASAVIIVIMLSFVSFRMHRQQLHLSQMIPMEARVLHKHANVAKRLGLMLLTVIAFHLPAMGALLGLVLGVNISETTIQWIFGFVTPLAGLTSTLLYLCLAGIKRATVKQFLPKYKSHNGVRKTSNDNGEPVVNNTKSRPPNIYICPTPENSLVQFEKSPNRPKELKRMFSGSVPGEISWIQDVVLAGNTDLGKYGIGEWQASNGSPRRGLIKVFPPSQYKKWTWETSILAKLNHFGRHVNVVEFIWASTSSQTRMTNNGEEYIEEPIKLERYLCTAFYPHGTLRGVLRTYPKRFTETLAHQTALQISQGLAFLHEHQISHQDLTSKNCHIGGKLETMTLRVVITNFGKSMDLSKHKMDEMNEDFSGFSLYSQKNGRDAVQASSSLQDLHLIVGEVQRLYANDVRAFALILLELLETVRQHQVLGEETDVGVCRKHFIAPRPASTLPLISIPQTDGEYLLELEKQSSLRLNNGEISRLGYNNSMFAGEETLPGRTEVEDNDPTKRHSVCSSDSGISSNRESMRSKGSSIGSSFSSKEKRKVSGERKSHGNDSGAVQALMRLKGKHYKDESETDTTEVGDSSSSSVEELDRLASLPNFAARHRKSDVGNCYSSSINQSLQVTQTEQNESDLMNERRKLVQSKSLEEKQKSKDDLDLIPSALPRSSNSFSKFYVIRSSDPKHRLNLTPVSTPSPKLRSKHKSGHSELGNGSNSCPLTLEDGHTGRHDIPMRSMTPDQLISNFNEVGSTSTFPRSGSMIIPQETVPVSASIHSRRSSDIGIFHPVVIHSWTDPRFLGGMHSLPRKSRRQQEETCPSNLTTKHMVQCQELLNLMDGLRALSLINRVHTKEDCHKVVLRWILSLRVESCLFKQLAQVLKSVWTRDPPHSAQQVFKKLDNCLTEVDL